MIGGDPARFTAFVDLYERALAHFGHPGLPLAVHSPGFVAATDEEPLESRLAVPPRHHQADWS